MSDNTYSTTDFGFATYLLSYDIDVVDVTLKDRYKGICEFEFLISAKDEVFIDLENKWYKTDETKRERDILMASKILKGKLKVCLVQNNVPRKI